MWGVWKLDFMKLLTIGRYRWYVLCDPRDTWCVWCVIRSYMSIRIRGYYFTQATPVSWDFQVELTGNTCDRVKNFDSDTGGTWIGPECAWVGVFLQIWRSRGLLKPRSQKKGRHPEHKQKQNWFPTPLQVAQRASHTIDTICGYYFAHATPVSWDFQVELTESLLCGSKTLTVILAGRGSVQIAHGSVRVSKFKKSWPSEVASVSSFTGSV
jgi:hypothetical protein